MARLAAESYNINLPDHLRSKRRPSALNLSGVKNVNFERI